MNTLNTNNPINNYQNYNTDLNIETTCNDKIISQDSKNEINSTTNLKTDSIELNPNRKNILNKINAHKAYNETFDELGLSVEELGHLTIEYGRIASQMQHHGYYVPDFKLDNSDPNTSSFFPFISQMKEFAKSYFSSGDHLVSLNTFSNFCDKWEENLNKYKCF